MPQRATQVVPQLPLFVHEIPLLLDVPRTGVKRLHLQVLHSYTDTNSRAHILIRGTFIRRI